MEIKKIQNQIGARHEYNLHDIQRACILIPVSVNYNPIITFVYEMCASTYVIHIRWASIPVLELAEGMNSK